MDDAFNPADNHERSRQRVGYVPRKAATAETYRALGFKSGLEIHQQLLTKQKLFCNCPAGIYQHEKEYDAEVIRHMRPTLSEMGEYDGTALMEKKTRKNIVYRLAYETACTYDIDDTPPFVLDGEALGISVEIALMLNLNIVGELHITRKQYLDGSIPTGFQRTGIIGIEGDIQLRSGRVRIIQMTLEEDSCREVSDLGHWRTYTTDRLGMPLIETVTYPDMETPDRVAEAAQYLRYLTRSSSKVRTGIGAARQDVNVSVRGGTRVEIKGVAHINWIPALTHVEAFRQKALLTIRDELRDRGVDKAPWNVNHLDLSEDTFDIAYEPVRQAYMQGHRVVAINLPLFKSLLSFFTQPGKSFFDELSDRVKVIACLEKPNLICSEPLGENFKFDGWKKVRAALGASNDDAQVIVWGPGEDVATAIETIYERCVMACEGVPNETRKSFADGTTIFERVLPGPDRMYPDTDSAPIPIEDEYIEERRRGLPPPIHDRLVQLDGWKVPLDCYEYILRNNLVGLIEKIAGDFETGAKYVATLFAHKLKHIEGKYPPAQDFHYSCIYDLFAFVHERQLQPEILEELLPEFYRHPNMDPDSLLKTAGYRPARREEILAELPQLNEKFDAVNTSRDPGARIRWIMGKLRPSALGNVSLRDLQCAIEKEVAHV
jgi:glutamyl-tRNA(Gln) amidotransferase subunit E